MKKILLISLCLFLLLNIASVSSEQNLSAPIAPPPPGPPISLSPNDVKKIYPAEKSKNTLSEIYVSGKSATLKIYYHHYDAVSVEIAEEIIEYVKSHNLCQGCDERRVYNFELVIWKRVPERRVSSADPHRSHLMIYLEGRHGPRTFIFPSIPYHDGQKKGGLTIYDMFDIDTVIEIIKHNLF